MRIFQNIIGLEEKCLMEITKKKKKNHILITDYGQEKYDYDYRCRVIFYLIMITWVIYF